MKVKYTLKLFLVVVIVSVNGCFGFGGSGDSSACKEICSASLDSCQHIAGYFYSNSTSCKYSYSYYSSGYTCTTNQDQLNGSTLLYLNCFLTNSSCEKKCNKQLF
jgi:hypothetical protein